MEAVCAYCDYPLDDAHEGGTTGEEQCPVCGANESRYTAHGMSPHSRKALRDLADGRPSAALDHLKNLRLVDTQGGLTSLGAAVLKILKTESKESSTIFLGNGEYSKRLVQELHELLDHGVSLLGFLQQPVHCDHEPSEEEQEREKADQRDTREELRATIRRIVEALGQGDLLISSDLEPSKPDQAPR